MTSNTDESGPSEVPDQPAARFKNISKNVRLGLTRQASKISAASSAAKGAAEEAAANAANLASGPVASGVKQAGNHASAAAKRAGGSVSSAAKQVGGNVSGIAKRASESVSATASQAGNAASKMVGTVPASLAFISQDELLRWTAGLTEGAATVYDKALDLNYLQTHIGGGNHRMFDGGHSIPDAFAAAVNALPDDSYSEEMLGFMSAVWKDVTTTKGLPFFTWDPESYNLCADWVVNTVPFADRQWFYDLCSFDALEILGATLPIVSVCFALGADDERKIAEILGAAGFVAVASANPLGGIAMICVAGYAYAAKGQRFDGYGFTKGAGLAGLSLLLFAVIGLPVLIELILILVITSAVRKRLPEQEAVQQFVVTRVTPALSRARYSEFRSEVWKQLQIAHANSANRLPKRMNVDPSPAD